uniref:Chromatin structure-remodeling complex protein BSH n=1 Tax=Leersia perrieri TaxID=77586 RepID=A0A0D9WCI8_9ORYZ
MKTVSLGASRPTAVKFRMPTRDNLVPIRVDVEVDGQRYRDAFTWNPRDPDSEVISFAKRTAKDLKLPANFVPQMLHSIQGQLAEFRSYEGEEMQIREKIVPLKIDLRINSTIIRDQFLWDIGNLDSDPEEFARTLCDDLNITDPEVGPAIAVSIREQLYEIASQSVSAMREAKVSKKGRRAPEFASNSKAMNNSLDLFKYFGSKGSVVRKRKEWYLYEPVVDVVPSEEAGGADATEEINSRSGSKTITDYSY